MNGKYCVQKIFRIITLLCCISAAFRTFHASAESYAIANLPTPVFNVPDFSRLFGGSGILVTDSCGQFRQLEFVALPGTVFHVTEKIAGSVIPVYRVTTSDYPYPSRTGYFIDGRFVTLTETRPPDRIRKLPPRGEVIERLLSAQGSIYVWGGNVRSGIPEMREYFPLQKGVLLKGNTEKRWELKGIDCSGLLYEATNGYSPRNTSSLVGFGRRVPIAGLSTEEIIRRVEPLDLIVWRGHVLVILDRERLVESYLDCITGGGVRVRPLRQALDEIRKNRIALDEWKDEPVKGKNGFVIRRWYPND